MKLSEVKEQLHEVETVNFVLEDGSHVPEHFHITEVGLVTKHFIDCGGTVRKESVVNFQLWMSSDYDHRLQPQKLLNIIKLSERTLGLEDLEVEVEYQAGTIGKYDLAYDGKHFVLLNKQTACLAQDQCGVAYQKQKLPLSELKSCTPGGGCC